MSESRAVDARTFPVLATVRIVGAYVDEPFVVVATLDPKLPKHFVRVTATPDAAGWHPTKGELAHAGARSATAILRLPKSSSWRIFLTREGSLPIASEGFELVELERGWATGEHRLVQRLERGVDWTLSAVEDRDAPCASVRGLALPALDAAELSVPVTFPAIPDNTELRVSLWAIANPSPAPRPMVQIEVYRRRSEADLIGESQAVVGATLENNLDTRYEGLVVLPVPGGYWWRIAFFWTFGDGQIAGYNEILAGYPVNATEEVWVGQNFGAG